MLSGREGRTFWTLSLAHMINDSYVFFLPTLLPLLIPSLDISLTAAGLAVGLYQVIGALAQPFLGHLADRYSLRWMSFVGLVGTAIGAGGVGVAPSYWALLLLMIVGAVGTSAYHPVATATISDIARARRGQAMSIYITAGNVGLAVGPAALGLGLPIWGPAITVPLALPCLLIALAVYVVVPPRVVRGRGPGSFGATIVKHRVTLGKLLGIATLRSWANVGLGTFLPLLLVERGLSVEDGATALTVLLLFGGIGGLVGGFLSDRVGRDAVIVTSLLLSAPAGWLMLHAPGIWLWIGAALVGFTLNGALLALTVRAQELMPDSVAMVSGLMLGFTVGMGGLAVPPLAALAEWVGLATVADISAALPLLAGALAFTLRRPAGQTGW
ncbi:MAG: MFS transporter [Chloroflexi bacterium]|nr:MFS transporter [Chloroflexota bacterium]